MLVRKKVCFVLKKTIEAIKEPISKEIIDDYYACVRCCSEHYDNSYLKEFKEKHPKEYAFLSAVHHKRASINLSIRAMLAVREKIYFGTLTFNAAKNDNQNRSKRKEAFKFLNKLFRFVLLVEELGEEKGRYHIHFLGTFNKGYSFSDFAKGWHSRQNLREVNMKENVASYLCKYVGKDLPRLRRNRRLVALVSWYRGRQRLQNLFPTVFEEQLTQLLVELDAKPI